MKIVWVFQLICSLLTGLQSNSGLRIDDDPYLVNFCNKVFEFALLGRFLFLKLGRDEVLMTLLSAIVFWAISPRGGSRVGQNYLLLTFSSDRMATATMCIS